jgi:hypothetical protein
VPDDQVWIVRFVTADLYGGTGAVDLNLLTPGGSAALCSLPAAATRSVVQLELRCVAEGGDSFNLYSGLDAGTDVTISGYVLSAV